MKEGLIVAECLEWLAVRRIFAHRNNTGAIRSPDGAWIKFGHPGSADIYGLIPGTGRFLAIECKTSKGKQRENQKLFQAIIENNGGLYIVARGVDDLVRNLPGF